MRIDSINTSLVNIGMPKEVQPGKNKEFGNVLTNFIGEVNQAQNNASDITNEYLTGGDVEIHDVMIAGEKAKTTLDLLMEIRNKTVDMYKELTRMQV